MKTLQILAFLLPLSLLAEAQTQSKPTVEQLFSVQTVKVKQESAAHSKKNYGFITVNDANVYDISPRYGGYVEKLYANKIYQFVHKGDPLVTLYSPEVYKAKEDYLNSYKYTKIKNNTGMLKSAKLNLQLLDVNNKEIANVLQKQRVSRNTTIYAPTSGYIFAKNITNGSAFSAKKKLFTIVNLDTVWVETKIFEEDVPWIKQSKDFTVTLKTTNKVYKTHTKILYPDLSPKEETLTMRLVLNNKDHTLFPGMYANIVSEDKKQTYLTLPQSAVILKDGKYYAFMVGEYEGEYDPVSISVKPLNNHTYVILSGLKKGDEVVNNALFMLDSDAQINGLY